MYIYFENIYQVDLKQLVRANTVDQTSGVRESFESIWLNNLAFLGIIFVELRPKYISNI